MHGHGKHISQQYHYFVGNRIRHNTKSSREFSEKISQDKGTIAIDSRERII